MDFNVFEGFEAQLILLDVIDNVIRMEHGSNFTKNAKGYNFRCEMCGDSKTRTHMKRGWVLTSKWPYMRYCHNCQTSFPASLWLKEKYPDYHREYVRRTLEASNPKKKKKIKKDDFAHLEFSNLEKAATVNATSLEYYNENFKDMVANPENEGMQHFSSMTDDAIAWCKSRKIPEEVYSKWYFAPKGMYSNRVVIPFYDKSNRLYYYQTRTIGVSSKKYLNPVSDIKPLYNIMNVNINQPVIFVEGVIDSLFLNNSVAMNGAKVSSISSLDIPKENMLFMLDNDPTGRRMANDLLKEGYQVFLWKKFFRDTNYEEEKDVNSIVLLNNLEDLKTDGILNYFSSNIFHRSLI